ncbi:MAG: peptidylprolyl isomerase [Deltaproteobacteria bacterium]|nr:peptidylprolyl isomerase [Deltaproteobacteria bacterium]
MKRLLKEPLVHFLAGGRGLFVLFGIVNRGSDGDGDPYVVLVDRDALLTFVQYRTKAFEPSVAAARLDKLSDEELERLIDDYVREEVLHREALALGLDRDDYVIRRRLVQKVEFITEGFAEASSAVDEAALRRYFEANKDDYYVAPYVTFTHVFFETEDRPREQARALAGKKLAELNRDKVLFSEAPQHGERFLYHVNYVERTPEYVASHFGVDMAKALFELPVNDEVWVGPFDSPYGAHLVMLTTNEPGREPLLEEIKGRVIDDARRAAVRERTTEAIGDIVDAYDVRIVYQRDEGLDAGVEGAVTP